MDILWPRWVARTPQQVPSIFVREELRGSDGPPGPPRAGVPGERRAGGLTLRARAAGRGGSRETEKKIDRLCSYSSPCSSTNETT